MELAIKHLQKDSIMKRIIEQSPDYKRDFDAGEDVYFALLESIVSQQISVKAADSIFKRFCELFDNNYPKAEFLLDLDIETLRTAGLSFQKINYLKNVAGFHLEYGIDFEKLQRLDDEAVVQYLIPIKGVGRWTVEMLLMFVLGREDVYPFDDLIVRQNTMKAYNVDLKGKELKIKLFEIAQNWSPYRSLACRYLWRFKGFND